MPGGSFPLIAENERDVQIVAALVQAARLMGEKPSAARIIDMMRACSSRPRGGMNRGRILAIIDRISKSSETISEPAETVFEHARDYPRLFRDCERPGLNSYPQACEKANDLADEYALRKKARQMTEEAAEEFTPEQRAANLQRFKSMFRDFTHRRTRTGAT